MYFNDIHVLWYLFAIILGGIVGQIIDFSCKMFLQEKKIISKENIKNYIKICLPNYILIFIVSLLYVSLLYLLGPKGYLDIIRFTILIPMLLIAFIVDYKEQIIPNRLNLLIFETGLIFTFILGITNINMASNLLLGMLAGGGIFLAITLIGGAIAGKEAMGLGDVKLMGALGLYFGLNNTILISVLSFLLGAIISIILMIAKKNKAQQYIPFGPFIVLATIITIFVPFNILFNILLKVFSLGLF